MERIKNYATALFLCLVLLLQGCLKVDEENFYAFHTGEATLTEAGVVFEATIDKKFAQNVREFGVEYKFVYGDDDSDTWKRIACQKALQNNSFTTLLEFSELEKNAKNPKGELLSQIKYVAYCDFSGSEEIAEERTFQITLCRLTAKSSDEGKGLVTGSGTYCKGSSATITATPKENYYFTGWSDSDSRELTRTITITSDSTITAIFSEKPYLTAKPNNSDYGTVTGSGHYAVGSEATITATPKENCYFTGWSDCDSRELTRTVQVNSDTTITAIFAKNPYLTAKPNNSNYGTVTGSGLYEVGTKVTITATPKENCYFTGWSDCDSKELTRIVQVNSDTTITAIFSKNPYLTAKPNNSNYGTVTGSGLYEVGTKVTITATPKGDIEFVQWNDGNTENPRTVTVTSDVTYTATFKVNAPDGAFSVSSGRYVLFSPGNLQYTQSTNTWSFAANQWDMIGTDNVTGGSVSSYPTKGDYKYGTALADKVDLFGWSTSTTNFGVSTSTDNDDYSGSFVDWGTNQIGDDVPNTWRTLTWDEWGYLRWERPNCSNLCGVAQVNGVNGLILLPDGWSCPDGVTFRSGFHDSNGVDYYAAYQTFTAEQWSQLEAAGAVFLPAAGHHAASWVGYVQFYGGYWTASEESSNYAYGLHCHSDRTGMGYGDRYNGRSVRLVKDL